MPANEREVQQLSPMRTTSPKQTFEHKRKSQVPKGPRTGFLAKNGKDTGNVIQGNAICSALLQPWMVELILW